MSKERLIAMDFIRVIAMILIVAFHWNCMLEPFEDRTNYIISHVFANGNIGVIGVSLFFILSGAGLMYASKEDLNLKEYYKKRFLSIFPLFWLVYILVRITLVDPVVFENTPSINIIFTILGLDGFLNSVIPTYYLVGEWFLGCIILIYLIYPILWIEVKRKPKLTAIIGIILFVIYVKIYSFPIEVVHTPICRIPEVLFGMYFVLIYTQREKFEKKGIIFYNILSLVSLLILIFLWTKEINLPYAYVTLLLGISSFNVLFWIFGKVSFGPNISKVIYEISKQSYGIFLLHHIFMNMAITKLLPLLGNQLIHYLMFLIYIFVLFVMSWILNQVIKMIIKINWHSY